MYADIITTNLTAAGTTAANIMAAIAAHFTAAPAHYEVDFTGTGDAIVVAPKAAPAGYDHQAALRIDGSGNLCLRMDPSSGFSGGGSVASSASGGGALVATERSTSISSGIGSTTITIIEDKDWGAILLWATSKTHTVKGCMWGHTWDPLRPNWTTDLGAMGFGQHVGIPNLTSTTANTSGNWFGSGTSPVGGEILVNGVWVKCAMLTSTYAVSSVYQSTIPNGANPSLKPIVPLPITAVDINGTNDLYIGHARALGSVATNEDAAQLPRKMVDAGSPVVETWMHINITNAINNLVIAYQPNSTAP